MKTFVQTLFFFVLVTQISIAQWFLQNKIPNEGFLIVQLISPTVGWVVGDSIYKTTNGGETWISKPKGTDWGFTDICFTDVNTGTIVGSGGTILRTTDGGETWKSQSSGVTNGLRSVSFSDINNGTIVGEYGTILRTTNGGETWSPQTGGLARTLSSVSFTDVNTGTAVGDNGTILKTIDGGETWTPQSSGVTNLLFSVSFTDINNGTIVGEYGTILRTTNGGETWTPQSSGTTENLESVSFTDSNNGTAVGGYGTILRTSNGGESWTPQSSGTIVELTSVSFADANNGMVVSPGLILKTTNGGNTWTSLTGLVTPGLKFVSFVDANNGTAVGDYGTILRTTDGGETWSFQSSGHKGWLESVSFTDVNNGIIVGWDQQYEFPHDYYGVILLTTNSGETWTSQSINTPNFLHSVFFIDANTATVVGDSGKIFHTTNGGDTWTPQSSGTFTTLSSVSFTDINHGIIVGGGIILRTTNGGDSWASELNSTYGLNSVAFANANKGTAVGYNGTMLRTTDGGETWNSQASGTTVDLKGVSFTDENNGAIVGSSSGSAVFLSTSNGGESWTLQNKELRDWNIGPRSSLSSVSFADANNGIVVGAYSLLGHTSFHVDGGIILRTTNGGVVPVELSSFTATTNGKEVTLNWSTATELNNQGFEVQRKFGSNDFVTIGSVRGQGTTTSPNNYTYIDKLVDAGKYFYRLKQIDFGGKYEYSQVVEVNWSPFTTYKLEQNYPNPFNPTTTIGFGIPEKDNVRLSILNVLGEEIRVLLKAEKEAGYHSIDFNASDLPSGAYFYQLKAGEFLSTKKMLLLK